MYKNYLNLYCFLPFLRVLLLDDFLFFLLRLVIPFVNFVATPLIVSSVHTESFLAPPKAVITTFPLESTNLSAVVVIITSPLPD